MLRASALIILLSVGAAASGRNPYYERPRQGELQPAQSPRKATQDRFFPEGAPSDDDWATADPSDPRSSGNLGPAGSGARKDIAPSAPAGTPGERVPEHPGPTGLPGDDMPTEHPHTWRY